MDVPEKAASMKIVQMKEEVPKIVITKISQKNMQVYSKLSSLKLHHEIITHEEKFLFFLSGLRCRLLLASLLTKHSSTLMTWFAVVEMNRRLKVFLL